VTGFAALLEAHELAARLGEDQLVLLPYWAATEMMIDYDPSGAVRQFDEVVELAQTVGNKGLEARALAAQAVALSRLGEFGRAHEAARRALDAAALSDSAIKIADVDMLVGTAYFDMGRAEEAFELVERGRKLAEDVDGVECACYGWRQQGL